MTAKRKSTIQRQQEEESFQEVPLHDGQLEMLSEEENEDLVSDDGLVDDFPELNVHSDSNGSETGNSISDDDDYDDSSENNDDSESVNSLHLFPKPKNVVSDITHQPKLVYPEIEPGYDSDSSTEDVSFLSTSMKIVNMIYKAPNRIGNVPSHWFDDLPHIGYDINGKQLLRPARGDELDKFLATVENSSAWSVSSDNFERFPLNFMFRASAFDKNIQMDKPLSSEELELIRRLYANEVPDANYDPYEPTTEWFTGKGKEEIMPISGALQPKRRWVPSKWEKQKVTQQTNTLRMSFTALSGLENCSSNSARSHTPFEAKKYLEIFTLCNLVRAVDLPPSSLASTQTTSTHQRRVLQPTTGIFTHGRGTSNLGKS